MGPALPSPATLEVICDDPVIVIVSEVIVTPAEIGMRYDRSRRSTVRRTLLRFL